MKKQANMQQAGERLATPKKRRRPWNRNDWTLILMASLGLAFLAVFAYGPLYGLLLAFKVDGEYINIQHAIQYGTWAGWDQFRDFLTDPDFADIMFNTLGLNLLQLLINFPAPIIFAILMSELLSDKFKKMVQTVTFFPHFLNLSDNSSLIKIAKMIGAGKLISNCSRFNPKVFFMISMKSGSVRKSLN